MASPVLSLARRFPARPRALARALSTEAAAAPQPALVDGGFAAVIGACYAGAMLWVYNDGLFTKMFGGEAKKAEEVQAKDQLTAIEDDLTAIRKAVAQKPKP